MLQIKFYNYVYDKYILFLQHLFFEFYKFITISHLIYYLEYLFLKFFFAMSTFYLNNFSTIETFTFDFINNFI